MKKSETVKMLEQTKEITCAEFKKAIESLSFDQLSDYGCWLGNQEIFEEAKFDLVLEELRKRK